MPSRWWRQFPDPVKQLKHCHPMGICYNLDSIDRGVRLPILYPTQVRLVEAAPLSATPIFGKVAGTRTCLMTHYSQQQMQQATLWAPPGPK